MSRVFWALISLQVPQTQTCKLCLFSLILVSGLADELTHILLQFMWIILRNQS